MEAKNNNQTEANGDLAPLSFVEEVFPSKFGPTHVVQFGLSDLISGRDPNVFKDIKRVVVMVPGNPGVVTFYNYFMESLHKRLGIPVIGFSHIGHITHNVQKVTGNATVKRQIKHKLELIESLIPQHVEIILIGHSIGSYMTLELSRMLKSRSRLIHNFLLFPCFERMGCLPQARRVTRLNTFRLVWYFMAYMLSLLSRPFQEMLVHKIVPGTLNGKSPPCVKDAILESVNWRVVRNLVDMSEDEFHQIEERDDRLIEENLDKLTFIYGKNDHWCPIDYYESVKDKFSGDIRLVDIQHAFVMNKLDTDAITEVVVEKIKSF